MDTKFKDNSETLKHKNNSELYKWSLSFISLDLVIEPFFYYFFNRVQLLRFQMVMGPIQFLQTSLTM